MGRCKQKKYEKELRDRRAAEEKVNKQEERKAAEKERRASLTEKERTTEDNNNALWGFVLIAVIAIVVFVSCQSSDDSNDSSSSPAAEETYTYEDDDDSYSDDTVSSADAEQWLKGQLGVSEFSEILASDPTLWGGYINGIEVDGSMMHVRLQVDHDADQEMADRAAHAIANLARMTSDSTVDGLSWVIIEDGTGRNMAQESV
jgi:hypothetical protein